MNRVSLNTALQVLTRGIELSSGLFVNACLARQWGSQAFGQIGFIAGLASVCAFLFHFGLGNLLTRTIARDPKQARHYLVNALIALLPLALLGSAVLLGLGVASRASVYSALLALSCAQMVLAAVSQLIRATFYAFERMEFDGAAVFGERACILIGGLYLAFLPPNLWAYFACLVFSKAVNVLVSAVLFVRHILPLTERAVPRLSLQKGLLKQAFPFGLDVAFTVLYTSLDVILIASWGGEEAAGQYRAVGMLVLPLTMIALALINSLFPRMSALGLSDPEAFGACSRSAARLLMLAAMPIALFTFLYAPSIVATLFGPAYAPAAPLLRVLSLVIPLRFINELLATSLTACDRQRRRTLCVGIVAAFSTLAYLVLIARYHAQGAAITALCAELVMLALLARGMRPLWGAAIPGGEAAARGLVLAGAILLPLAWLGVPLWAAAVALGVIYPLLLVRGRVLTEGELQLLRG
ncbi:flippase [bacterium]|nr:flippase [bacterium]